MKYITALCTGFTGYLVCSFNADSAVHIQDELKCGHCSPKLLPHLSSFIICNHIIMDFTWIMDFYIS